MGISDMCPYGSTQYEWMRTAEVRAAALARRVTRVTVLSLCVARAL